MLDYELFTLPNGIRIVHKQVNNSKIVHCGFMLDIGSRDEKADQQGLAHFWEHMAFKGTQKRKAFHILNRLDSVGGELNAYTTKEKICFHASVLDSYFEQAFELLADITFDSVFPEKQIEKERNVILEEMMLYLDTPEDSIQDEFDTTIFGEHQLGKNILGDEESVKRVTRDDFKRFIQENLISERIIFSSVGNMPMKKVIKLAEKYISHIPVFSANRKRIPFTGYQPRIQEFQRPIKQAHCAIGRTAYAISDAKRMPFFMLVNILGGPGMNSKLNLSLREKYGYVYSVDANYSPYTDTGQLGIFFGTEPSQLDKSIKLVIKELEKIQKEPFGTTQLHKYKVQLMGQLAMAEENNMSLMIMMAKSLLDLERIDSLDEIFAAVESVSASQLQEVAREMFQIDSLSMLKYIPSESV